LQFDLDQPAFQRLLAHRLGRAVLLTNRTDWSAEQVVAGTAASSRWSGSFEG
jgi:hypothetical protein